MGSSGSGRLHRGHSDGLSPFPITYTGLKLAKTNYSYAKRQREIAKKQKKEEKRRQKSETAEQANPDALPETQEGDPSPADPQP